MLLRDAKCKYICGERFINSAMPLSEYAFIMDAASRCLHSSSSWTAWTPRLYRIPKATSLPDCDFSTHLYHCLLTLCACLALSFCRSAIIGFSFTVNSPATIASATFSRKRMIGLYLFSLKNFSHLIFHNLHISEIMHFTRRISPRLPKKERKAWFCHCINPKSVVAKSPLPPISCVKMSKSNDLCSLSVHLVQLYW